MKKQAKIQLCRFFRPLKEVAASIFVGLFSSEFFKTILASILGGLISLGGLYFVENRKALLEIRKELIEGFPKILESHLQCLNEMQGAVRETTEKLDGLNEKEPFADTADRLRVKLRESSKNCIISAARVRLLQKTWGIDSKLMDICFKANSDIQKKTSQSVTDYKPGGNDLLSFKIAEALVRQKSTCNNATSQLIDKVGEVVEAKNFAPMRQRRDEE